MNIGVCEDDTIQCAYLKKILRQYAADKNLVYQVDTYKSAEALLEQGKRYDILFLEISLPGMDGIALGMKIREKNKWVKIVYVTAHPGYSSQAFHVHAFDYLIKPVPAQVFYEKFTELLAYMRVELAKTKLNFKNEKEFLCLEPREIYYIKAIPNHRIRLSLQKEKFEIRGGIEKTLQQMMRYGFVKSHKSYIVNIAHITRIGGGCVYMDNAESVPLADKGARAFKDNFAEYLRKTQQFNSFA